MPPADNARPQKRWGKPRLFHLETDPAEAHDLAAANPQMVERLHEAWTRWSDPFPPAVSKTAGK